MALRNPSSPLLFSSFPSRQTHRPLSFFFSQRNPPLSPSLKNRSALSPVQSASQDETLSGSVIITEPDQEPDGYAEDELPPLPRPLDHPLAERWREIQGRDDWAGLLDPMDPLLRSELIRYGEMSQACYDAFDYDPFSRYCGCCKYNRRHFFQSLGMADSGYEVTRYLFATSSLTLPNVFTHSRWSSKWSERANWIGYVAVATDDAATLLGRRDIAVAWRGTVTRLEWLADLMDFLRPLAVGGIPCSDHGVKVESGFLELYTGKDPDCRFCKFSAREQVLAEVRKLVETYTANGEEVSVTMTGHSLGSALAMLSAFDVAETGATAVPGGGKVPVTVFSFSGPRVGNGRWKERFEGVAGVKALRVVNVHDTVPKVPGILFNERVPLAVRKVAEILPWSYSHVGVELLLDHRRSPFLKDTGDPSCFHNLEAHLHLLDGYHGRGQRFVLASGRDPALVNKACDFLKDHHLVPPFWRQDENKGMIRAADGRWVQPDRPKVDDHRDDTPHHLRLLGLLIDRHKE
ncbi:Phospholipase A1-Igamma1, chloroplastic [Apostasia shenzhenica]|uniref:Phospholipase A1-Igamma1, chloroplastic n=1 Tax=Apostasia shenzhenica TaxID=1088818 RepID=A0A2I0B520_9ASPA|nr:Phospholipase A1-Igamma1, chloroplastic [Apostasia shenzhenica]